MNTLATCTARFTRAWMPVFALILLGASPSIFAATATLAPVAYACAQAGANASLTSPANSAVPVLR